MVSGHLLLLIFLIPAVLWEQYYKAAQFMWIFFFFREKIVSVQSFILLYKSNNIFRNSQTACGPGKVRGEWGA